MAPNGNIRVLKKTEQPSDTTDIALFVSTSSKEEINLWDKEKIVDSLILETDATPELARHVADQVEQRIVAGGMNKVTTSIIRELVDLELLELGLGTMHEKHSHLGLPMYDVEQIILNANKENSNTTHNPESINLTLAETLLKEYALRRVFSEDVSRAHMMGDVHLHDLGFIVRPYSYMGETLITWRKKESKPSFRSSMEQLYDLLLGETSPEPGVHIKYPADLEILDRDGTWSALERVVRKERYGKAMTFLATSDGRHQVVTYDHPVIVEGELKPACMVQEGDILETHSEPVRGSLDLERVLGTTANPFKFRFNVEDLATARSRSQQLLSAMQSAGRTAPVALPSEARPAPGAATVIMAEEVQIQDQYIYDVTTSTGTLIANGIYSHNCGGHSLDYIKKYGISLPNITSTSKPARHPEVLIGHMVKMASTLQSHYAGAIGWEAVNMFFAPYLVGLPYERIQQLAQMLIYEFNQLAGARGSLRGDEKIFVYDKQETSLDLVEIGRFVDRFTGTEGEGSAPVDEDRYYALSFDHETGRTVLARIYAAIRHENRHQVVELQTGQGQTVKVTDNHSLFMFDEHGQVVKALPSCDPEVVLTPAVIDIDLGERELDTLEVLSSRDCLEEDGMVLLAGRAPSKLGIPCKLAVTPELARLVGYYVSEGSLGSQVRLHVLDDALAEDVRLCVQQVFGVGCTVRDGSCHFGGRTHVALFEVLCGRGARNKRVPAAILLNNEEIVREFLAAYLSGDGYVSRNRIGCSTVSDDLKSHLWLAFTRLGAIPSIRTDDLEPLDITGITTPHMRDRHVIAIGRKHFDAVRFVHPEKEKERVRILETASKLYDQRRYSYESLRGLIKGVFGDRVSVKKMNRITPEKIRELLDDVEARISAVDIAALEHLAGEDTAALCKRYVADAGLPPQTAYGLLRQLDAGRVPVHSCHIQPDRVLEGTDYGALDLRRALDALAVPRAIEPETGLNDSAMFFDASQLDSNFNMLHLGLKLAIEQHARLRELRDALIRCSNLLPASVRSIETVDNERFVYDIGVAGTENFLTGDGIFAHNSQVVFTDFNLYWNVPRHFRDVPAIGPGGEYTGKTYGEYEKEAQAFLKALFEIYYEGDSTGKTFVFPKPLLHINEDFFQTEGHEEFLDLACRVAAHQGITYFIFDRGDEVTVSQCCRLKLKLNEEDLCEALTPERMRFSALQNITVNLPRVAYKAAGSDEILFSELERLISLVANAHMQKRKFVSELLDLGVGGPLSMLCAETDGEPYLRLDRLTYLVGLLGLNEMVQYHTGKELHEDDAAFKFGLKVIASMKLACQRLTKELGIHLVLEESPAESSGYRLAKLDMRYFPKQTRQVIKGSPDTDEYYYTNSIHLNVDADIDYIERVEKQSKFHPLIEAGAICHIWLGENEPDAGAIKSFVVKTFKHTQAAQIAFSPEFTVCDHCRRTARGLSETCPYCGSDDVYGITRIVGYFSKITTWNKGKTGELRDRQRTALKGGNGEVKGIRAG